MHAVCLGGWVVVCVGWFVCKGCLGVGVLECVRVCIVCVLVVCRGTIPSGEI